MPSGGVCGTPALADGCRSSASRTLRDGQRPCGEGRGRGAPAGISCSLRSRFKEAPIVSLRDRDSRGWGCLGAFVYPASGARASLSCDKRVPPKPPGHLWGEACKGAWTAIPEDTGAWGQAPRLWKTAKPSPLLSPRWGGAGHSQYR